MGKEIKEGFALEVVSVRLVRDAPILSGEEIKSPEDAVRLVGSSFPTWTGRERALST